MCKLKTLEYTLPEIQAELAAFLTDTSQAAISSVLFPCVQAASAAVSVTAGVVLLVSEPEGKNSTFQIPACPAPTVTVYGRYRLPPAPCPGY
ncbi:hypothetical protein D9M68_185400 [compost metagenome]